jgi:enoyl-CoA hydratase/carnithine racemase
VSALLRERRGHIEILTINRPEARNAINGAVSRAFVAAFDELEADDECAVVIVTGAGDKAFSAGMDLKAFAAGEGGEILGAKGGFGGFVQRDFAKPLIAAVNGAALAGGFEIMLACDLVVATAEARFGLPEATRGLVAAAGGLIRLPKRIAPAIALELALTGAPIDADRAFQLGLINRVVPADRLMDEAMALAATVAANAPLSVRTTKRVMQQAAELTEAEGWGLNDVAMDQVFNSADALEGATAFAEKRAPNWSGS